MILLFLFIIIIPLQFYFDIYGSVTVSLAQAGLPIILVYALYSYYQFKRKQYYQNISFVDRPDIVVGVTMFFVAISISVIRGLGYENLLLVAKWSGFITAFFSVYLITARSRNRLVYASLAVFSAGILVSAIAMIEYFISPEKIVEIIGNHRGFVGLFMEPSTLGVRLSNYGFNWYRAGHVRVFGSFINVNDFSAFIGLCMPFGFLLWENSSKLIYRILLSAAEMLMAITVFLTLSRGGWAGLFAAVMVSLILITDIKKNQDRNHRRIRKIFGILMSLLAFSVLLVSPLRRTVVNKISTAGEAFEKRKAIWQEALTIINNKPFTGAGLGNYGIAFNKYLPEKKNPRLPHSNYLYIAGEMGFLGLTLFLILIVSGLWTSVHLLAFRRLSGITFIVLWVWILIHGFFEHFIWGDKYGMMFWVAAGLNAAAVKIYRPKDVQ